MKPKLGHYKRNKLVLHYHAYGLDKPPSAEFSIKDWKEGRSKFATTTSGAGPSLSFWVKCGDETVFIKKGSGDEGTRLVLDVIQRAERKLKLSRL